MGLASLLYFQKGKLAAKEELQKLLTAATKKINEAKNGKHIEADRELSDLQVEMQALETYP